MFILFARANVGTENQLKKEIQERKTVKTKPVTVSDNQGQLKKINETRKEGSNIV